MRSDSQRTFSWPANLAFVSVFLLMFFNAFLAFSNRGALGDESQFRRASILILSNALMIALVLPHLLQRPRVGLAHKVMVLWILCMPITCVNLLPDGAYAYSKALMGTLYCPLCFLCFYTFTRSRPFVARILVTGFAVLQVFVLVLFILIFNYRTYVLPGVDYRQLNDVYYPLLLLPWTLLIRRPIIRNMGIMMVVSAVLWSFKRTAVIAIVLSMSSYFLTEMLSRKGRINVRKVFVSAVMVLSLLLLLWNTEARTGGRLAERFRSIQDDGGSGRLDIYNSVVQAQSASTLLAWVVGHGHDGVIRLEVHPEIRWYGFKFVSAHNDWLETLFDHGLPCLILYGLLHLAVIRATFVLIRKRSPLASPMAASYALFLVMSLTSHLVLYPTYFSYLMAFWGVLFAHIDPSCSLSNKRKASA